MMQVRQQVQRRHAGFRRWWVQWFTLLLFVWGVSYSPVHLALETHVGDLADAVGWAESQAAGLTAAEHDHGSGHAPHLASDHLMRLLSQAPVFFPFLGVFIAPDSLQIYAPHSMMPLFLTERQNPPGLPPPDPFQPRGPPLA